MQLFCGGCGAVYDSGYVDSVALVRYGLDYCDECGQFFGNRVGLLVTKQKYPGAEYVLSSMGAQGYCWVKNQIGCCYRLSKRQIRFEMTPNYVASPNVPKNKAYATQSTPSGGGTPVGGRYSSYGRNTGSFTPPTTSQARVKCTITWDSAAGVYSVSTPYEPNFVEFIKAKIPGRERAWDPNTKLWTFEETWLDVVQALATELWGAPAVSVTSKADVEQAEKAQREAQRSAIVSALPERERAIFEFVSALPFEAVQAAYRKAALLLHPDRNAVDGEAMAKLNAAWSKVEKEFKK